MQHPHFSFRLLGTLAVSAVAGLLAAGVSAQQLEEQFYSLKTPPPDQGVEVPHPNVATTCRGTLRQVSDVGFENVRTTAWNWSAVGGGGEGGRYDPVPLLSTSVTLTDGTCLNAHLSAIVGSRQTYGPGVAALTLFQVTLTPPNGAPQHMFGHYETPYGVYAPAVAVEAERDVDTFGANFFQRVGTLPGDVPPGTYRVDVWWAGGPIGGGGAIGAGFVLKLYLN